MISAPFPWLVLDRYGPATDAVKHNESGKASQDTEEIVREDKEVFGPRLPQKSHI
jgi:hypothetical protein